MVVKLPVPSTSRTFCTLGDSPLASRSSMARCTSSYCTPLRAISLLLVSFPAVRRLLDAVARRRVSMGRSISRQGPEGKIITYYVLCNLRYDRDVKIKITRLILFFYPQGRDTGPPGVRSEE